MSQFQVGDKVREKAGRSIADHPLYDLFARVVGGPIPVIRERTGVVTEVRDDTVLVNYDEQAYPDEVVGPWPYNTTELELIQMKFQVGDRVRVVRTNDEGLGTIECTDGDFGYPYRVALDDRADWEPPLLAACTAEEIFPVGQSEYARG